MKKNLKVRFLSSKEFISATSNVYNFKNKSFKIITEKWLDCDTGSTFMIQNIDDIVELYLIDADSNIFVNKDFLEVTSNPIFEIDNICNNSVIKTNTYIEGADGTGKTTTVNGLASRGIITIDRCVEYITKIMNQNDLALIIESVQSFLKNNPTVKVIFLYISNKEEHYKRIFNREIISDYDKTAFELQKKYLYTYNTLSHYRNLYLVDTYNKTKEQVQRECEEIALARELVNDKE